MVRRTWVTPVALLTACCLGVSCAETTRYRILTFFFEGVPKPGAAEEVRPPAEVAESGTTPQPPGGTPEQPEEARELQLTSAPGVRMHPPYLRFRCGACHAPEGGRVTRTPQEGLCRQCHDVPGELPYVHGPVAVSDCLFCHHHHGGEYPMMLRADPVAVCFRCHDADDLTPGDHHAAASGRVCTDCHHGHGGDNRFFLKPDRP